MSWKRKIHNIKRFITDNSFRFSFFESRGFYNRMDDRRFLQKLYYIKLGKKLDLEHPKGFNGKLQWLKLHDFKPEYSMLVDKCDVKKYVSERIGEEHIIPTLGVWNRVEEVDFASLPSQFVLKCTHDSGGSVICKDKGTLDVQKTREKLKASMSRNWFYHGREYPYKSISPRIIAEKYMVDSAGDPDNLTDYKFFCFNGVPRFVMTVRDRSKGAQQALHRFYNMEWELQDLDLDYRDVVRVPEKKPTQFEEMRKIAEVLSQGFRHIRVDLYIVDGRVYFGEMTFYHKSGFEIFVPEKWDDILGNYIDIEERQ